MSIFISIAAYREFDLVPTLRDCLRKAARPDRLTVGLCWQHEPSESLAEFVSDPRFRILDVPARESRGLGWARNQIQRLYSGERYVLQIDGHHRFVPGWDERCIAMIGQLEAQGYSRPIVTHYAPGFQPGEEPPEARWQGLGFHRFEPGGNVFFRPFQAARDPVGPSQGRFWSGHFSFARGLFYELVELDPTFYFHEELSVTVRAWTHGFDFFHPDRPVLWHATSRSGRRCVWDDDSTWASAYRQALARCRALLGLDGEKSAPDPRYGLGEQRSLWDYQQFSGLYFAGRGAQPETVANQPPGQSLQLSREAWLERLLTSYSRDLDLDRHLLEVDCDRWGLFCNDASGHCLFSKLYSRAEIEAVLQDPSPTLTLGIDFCTRARPSYWALWRRAVDGHWLAPLMGDW